MFALNAEAEAKVYAKVETLDVSHELMFVLNDVANSKVLAKLVIKDVSQVLISPKVG